MATLKELCKVVPMRLAIEAAEFEVRRRKNAAYLKRMQRLELEKALFERTKTMRPQHRRVKNTASSEAMGTIPTITHRVRTGKYTGVVCKSKDKYNF